MCGGFTCTKNALTSLNILYILVSFILIGFGAYGRAASIVSSVAIVGGIIGCGTVLFFLSLLGLVGAAKHNQILLFFYMVVLFALFVAQFSIACACLAVSRSQQLQLAEESWDESSDALRMKAQKLFKCCGFNNITTEDMYKSCHMIECCTSVQHCQCSPCASNIQDAIRSALDISGAIGIFFSFTEFVGVWLTIRYRNQKDPRGDPSAFL